MPVPNKNKTVLVTGSTGLVGYHLCQLLINNNYNVIALSTKTNNSLTKTYYWGKNYKMPVIDKADTPNYIIHLAGTNIGQVRWTKKNMQKIIDSRVLTANSLFNYVKNLQTKPIAFISASAVGIYGNAPLQTLFTENHNSGQGFLANTCIEWEKAADNFASIGIRTVKMRTAMVLAQNGGIFQLLSKLTKTNLISIIGKGTQYMPWIHINDLCQMYLHALQNNISGAFNAVAPCHTTNACLTKVLAQKLHKHVLLPPIPGIFIKLALGKKSQLVLNGNMVSANKIQNTGFNFLYNNLNSAISSLITS